MEYIQQAIDFFNSQSTGIQIILGVLAVIVGVWIFRGIIQLVSLPFKILFIRRVMKKRKNFLKNGW